VRTGQNGRAAIGCATVAVVALSAKLDALGTHPVTSPEFGTEALVLGAAANVVVAIVAIVSMVVAHRTDRHRAYAAANLATFEEVEAHPARWAHRVPRHARLRARLGRLRPAAGQVGGRSPYLQAVHLEGSADLIGQILPVTITGVGKNSIEGKLSRDTQRKSASLVESRVA
jgi:hypothetical protein